MDVDELIARAEITDVLYRYCRGIDRRDWDLLRSCYHDDAYDDHGSLVGPIDEFIRISKPFADRVAATVHFMGNVLIEVDGDVARAESYVVAYHAYEHEDGTSRHDNWAIRYLDRFERRDGTWKIAYRVVAHEIREIHQLPEGRGRHSTPGSWGAHDETDPLYWILDAKPPSAR